MEDIKQLVGQNTQLAVLNEDDAAGLMPVHLTSMGMALLAPSPAKALEGCLAGQAPEAAPRTLAEIRRIGYVTLDGFIGPESTGAAAPSLDARALAP